MSYTWQYTIAVVAELALLGTYCGTCPSATAAGIPWIDATFSDADLVAEYEIESHLARPSPASFGRGSLRELVAFLDGLGFETSIDTRAHKFSASDPWNTRVTWVQSPVSLRASLELTLRNEGLTFLVRHGLLRITTEDQAAVNLRTKLYDITHVVSRRQTHAFDPRGARHDPIKIDFDELIEQLQTVQPESWEDLGGSGTICGVERNGRALLAITQTDAVHRQIVRYLSGLRRLVGSRGMSESDPGGSVRRSTLPIAGRRRLE